MIKNFKLYNKPNKKARICALSLTGLLIAGCLTGCGTNSNIPNVIYGENQTTSSISKKTFEAGEHIISVPISDPTNDVIQHPYHPGYKCTGMATSSYGDLNCFAGACLLYINETAVECYSENGTTYTDFGIPLGYEKTEDRLTENGEKVFCVGEHILSIPIPNPTNKNVQYQSFEGYEAIDIATAFYGRLKCYAGGAILYVNTTPVTCTPTVTNNNIYQYLTFGTPIEPEKTLTKTNE